MCNNYRSFRKPFKKIYEIKYQSNINLKIHYTNQIIFCYINNV